MFYSYRITVQKLGDPDDSVEQEITLARGVITQIGYHFPAGCHALVGVSLWKGKRQIIPENTDEEVRGDNATFFVTEYIETTPYPYKFILKVSNLDTINSHSPIIYIMVLPKWVAAPMIVMEKILKILTDRLLVRLVF